jgi:hypothetical protein
VIQTPLNVGCSGKFRFFSVPPFVKYTLLFWMLLLIKTSCHGLYSCDSLSTSVNRDDVLISTSSIPIHKATSCKWEQRRCVSVC